ncbi:unnamed protein product [Phytophthora lilii]|uniref:Unnamed protein product n=1 Tax=Phytophthora lilii TaxID=2077276 RepID=A0A9W6TY63_9STRA|nr:unnamed protein product [Phytophthora lilii]
MHAAARFVLCIRYAAILSRGSQHADGDDDISETSLQLTFIIQITMIGRAVSVKVRVRSIVCFTNVAEAFIVLGWLNVLGCMLDAAGKIKGEEFHVLGNVLESVSLVFVIVFRFYYLSLSLSFRALVAERKAELLVYVLLVFHEFPFVILEHSTGVSSEFAQAICHRVLMISCILLNVQHKTRGSRSSYTVKSKRDSTHAHSKTSRGRHGSFLKTITNRTTQDRPNGAFPKIAKVAVTSIRLTNQAVASTNGRPTDKP